MQVGQTTIEVVRGSVLEQPVDAIVNAANTGMRGGGALDGAIHRAAGPGLLAELVLLAPRGAKTGDPVVTGGHNTPYKHIIHVAGPIFSGANVQEKDSQLASAYGNSLQRAHELGLESIGFPSISTGVFAFPLDRAAPIALRTAIDFVQANPETPLRRIIFAMFGGEEHHVFRRELERLEQPGMLPTLEDAVILAATKHRGQIDKAGSPYLLHPLRVMLNLGPTATEEERMAALLHDIVEDTDITFEALRQAGYPQAVIEAVEHLTKRPEEENDYEAAIRRVVLNPIARKVKLADLQDNLDLTRIASPTEKDHARLEKYRKAREFLQSIGK